MARSRQDNDPYDVQRLQAGLELLGFDAGRIDGVPGKNTNAAAKKFLEKNNIKDVDPANIREVLRAVQEKVLSDPAANKRLMEMAQNPASRTGEEMKILKGGLALHDIRTGPDHSRIVIDDKPNAQIKEAASAFTVAAPLNSTQVKMIQGGLTLLGYESGEIDGKIGKNTQAAMEKFAADRGMKNASSTDIFKAMEKAMAEPEAVTMMKAIGNSTNRQPAQNIMALQAGLSLAGYTTPIGGVMGKQTKDNFGDWQEKLPVTAPAPAPIPTPRADMAKAAAGAVAPAGAVAAATGFTRDEIKQRQAETLANLKDACASAGVSPELMLRIRRQESSHGTVMVSKTECLGDWQFTKKTFNACMNKYGTEIVAELEKRGDAPHAQKIRDYLASGGTSEDLRLDPTISTWMAAKLTRENADYLKNKIKGLDTTDPKTWDVQYAAYNAGPFAALQMATSLNGVKDAGKIIGKPAEYNPSYFTGAATGAEALERYGEKMNRKPNRGELTIEQQLREATGVSVAANKTDVAGKPLGPMEDFRAAVAGVVSDDRTPPLQAAFKSAGREITAPQTEQPKPLQPTLSFTS